MSIRIVSVNIEGDKHLATVRPFLDQEDAEVVCLMEVFEDQVEKLAGSKYPYRTYTPNVRSAEDNRTWGVAILSKYPITDVEEYHCGEVGIPQDKPGAHLPALVIGKIERESKVYQIGAVHFSWTPDGRENLRQSKHMDKLLEFLKPKGELILAGDFNIGRHINALYDRLAQYFHDNIPAEVKTTIDPVLHRANWQERGKLALVVDYVWTTSAYQVTNLRLRTGVSDHLGLITSIETDSV